MTTTYKILESYLLPKDTINNNYNIEKDIYDKIKIKLNNPHKKYVKNIYNKRNIYIEEINGQYTTYQKTQINFTINDKTLNIISEIKKLDVNNDDVPILSKYDNHDKINILEYKIKDLTILLEECNNKYFVHMISTIDTSDINNIIKSFEKLFI
jgi:hypothetical protein